MINKSKTAETLFLRYAATHEQWALLHRALNEAEQVKDPDIFLMAHRKALKSDLLNLGKELDEIRAALGLGESVSDDARLSVRLIA